MQSEMKELDRSFAVQLDAQRAALVHLCRRLTMSVEYAEDLVQETLVEAWRCRHQLRDLQSLSPWLAGIARNVCHSWLRKQRRRAPYLTISRIEDDPTETPVRNGMLDDFDIEIDLERKELIELLDRALSLLDADTRTLLVRRYVHESSLAEIARLLDIAPGTAAMRLQRGKLALRQVLASRFPQEIAAYLPRPVESVVWKETTIWCMRCGQQRLHVRLPTRSHYLNFVCPRCDGSGEAGSIHCPLPGEIKGYKRALLYSVKTYQPDSAAQTLPCLHCHRPNHMYTSFARDLPEWGRAWNVERGPEHGYSLYTYCDHCMIWMMLFASSFLLGHSDLHAFWQHQERIRLQPPREIEYAGQPAQLIRYESVSTTASVTVALSKARYQVLQVYKDQKV
ncbi:RNA polymerase sigma factor [Tengunoibacter tsumagoiensis]|uniref:RNA polymerase sigma factor n=1 Tax=Tengunoibacter tsumagoiensis TaxID=2014871 RepID=A0A402A8E7_9CHLR|nr:RNA polymerase sigma factor [Tengunoibacter tsumagoiensis]GCE15427.1 hypothetical protein KTT_52860 [Tengunoibacter tsumagoiensis]